MELWLHQKQVIESFEKNGSHGLWHDTGTGKTRSVVECIKTLADERAVIVCPNSVQETWVDNFKKWYPTFADHFNLVILQGSGAKKAATVTAALTNTVPTIFILNYEALDNEALQKALLRYQPQLVVADEVHRIKNYKSNRAKFLVNKLLSPYRLALTGTLESNRYQDIYMPFRFLRRDIFPDNFAAWERKHFFNANANKPWLNFPDWKPKPESLKYFEAIKLELGTVIKKELTLSLPPQVKQVHYVDLHENIARHYREMERDLVTWFESDNGKDAVSAQIALVKSLRLAQITCGILQGDELSQAVHQEKSSVLMGLLSELCPRSKVVVWANFIPAIEHVRKVAYALGHEERNIATIVGGQTRYERERERQRFMNESQCCIMIANQAAGGTGIDGLQVASYAIYYSKDFNYVSDAQSEGRTYRGGSEQHKSVTRIDILTRGTIDEVIHEALERKSKLQDFDVANLLRERFHANKRVAA
jgi:SNF2 family DNA or RNA helicase